MSRAGVLDQALAYARHGWPVFPCQPGRKTPATRHGYLDASTDPEQIERWFARHPDRNVAIATGLPGPDVLDVDQHGPARSGYPALNRLIRAGLTNGAAAWIATPSGGLHGYFAGTEQRSGHLPGQHIDFRSAGGYVLAPPSQVGGRPYHVMRAPGGHATLDWDQVSDLLEPARHRIGLADPTRAGHRPPGHGQPDHSQPGTGVDRLAAWVARLEEGNRNAGLFWAANRALDSGAADLSPLAAAARHTGLGDREITATLSSARRTPRPAVQSAAPDRLCEPGSGGHQAGDRQAEEAS